MPPHPQVKPTRPAKREAPAPRRKGRPTEAAAVGREALIATTQELLREAPPDRITLARIAQRAGVTPALVRYYFGSKEALLMATAVAQLEALQHKGEQALRGDAPIAQRLAARLAAMIEQVQANPRFHELLMDSVYTGENAESERLLAQAVSRGLMLTLALQHGARGAELRAVDPRFLHVAMIGMTEFFGSADVFLRQLFGAEAEADALRERYVAFLVDLLLQGLLPREGTVAAPGRPA